MHRDLVVRYSRGARSASRGKRARSVRAREYDLPLSCQYVEAAARVCKSYPISLEFKCWRSGGSIAYTAATAGLRVSGNLFDLCGSLAASASFATDWKRSEFRVLKD